MARLKNPDRNFSTDHDQDKLDLSRLMNDPPANPEDVFDNPTVREHIARLIVNAIRKSEWH